MLSPEDAALLQAMTEYQHRREQQRVQLRQKEAEQVSLRRQVQARRDEVVRKKRHAEALVEKANEDRVTYERQLAEMEAAEKAVAFARNRTRADLDSDEQLTLALTRLLEIVGEAAAAVAEPVRSEHTQIPWRAMIGTRNRLIHGYFDVDKDIVWKIVSHDLPHLVAELRILLAPN